MILIKPVGGSDESDPYIVSPRGIVKLHYSGFHLSEET
jgi:hypothetical protein